MVISRAYGVRGVRNVRVQASSYKMNDFWVSSVEHGDSVVHKCIKSTHCTPQIYTVLHVYYISVSWCQLRIGLEEKAGLFIRLIITSNDRV